MSGNLFDLSGAGEFQAGEQMIDDDIIFQTWLGRLRQNSVFHRVAKQDGLWCHWCGVKCNPAQSPNCDTYPTEEHIIRRADGGHRTMENIVVACRKCNNSRHNSKQGTMAKCTFPPSDFPKPISQELRNELLEKALAWGTKKLRKARLQKWTPKSHMTLRLNLEHSQRCPIRVK
jgi:hypothetical protein